MTFTDADLKLFKECADYKGPLLDQFCKLPALLARLEAAEGAIEHGDWCGCPKGKCTLDAWRKAAGK